MDEIVNALRAIGVRLGQPLRVDPEELRPATCLRCRAEVLAADHWPPPAILFDRVGPGLGRLTLEVHGCYFEDDQQGDPQ